jgi:hypothetical protein
MSYRKNAQWERAKYLYFNTNKTHREIAFIAGVTEQTVSKWVNQGAWAAEKKIAFHSPLQEIQHLYEEIREINRNILGRDEGKRFATKEELDLKTKIFGLINGHLSCGRGSWREIPPPVDVQALEEDRIEWQRVLESIHARR